MFGKVEFGIHETVNVGLMAVDPEAIQSVWISVHLRFVLFGRFGGPRTLTKGGE